MKMKWTPGATSGNVLTYVGAIVRGIEALGFRLPREIEAKAIALGIYKHAEDLSRVKTPGDVWHWSLDEDLVKAHHAGNTGLVAEIMQWYGPADADTQRKIGLGLQDTPADLSLTDGLNAPDVGLDDALRVARLAVEPHLSREPLRTHLVEARIVEVADTVPLQITTTTAPATASTKAPKLGLLGHLTAWLNE
jgi:hypothetical protein